MSTPPKKKEDPFLALRYPEFRYYLFTNFLLTFALLIQEVIIGYELYRITHDPLAIGLIGLAEAIPFIILSLFGGHYADMLSKKKIMLWSLVFTLLASVFLYFMSFRMLASPHPEDFRYVIWGVIFFIGACRAFFSPAATAMKAFLVPREVYGSSSTWSSSSWQTGVIAGPGISGFLYSLFGFSNTLLFVIAFIAIAIIFVFGIKDRLIEITDNNTMLQKIKEGFKSHSSYWPFRKFLIISLTMSVFSWCKKWPVWGIICKSELGIAEANNCPYLTGVDWSSSP